MFLLDHELLFLNPVMEELPKIIGQPQHREIEQTFDQNHRAKLANRFPGEQAALGAGKESMGALPRR
jgi:hypothetical protein